MFACALLAKPKAYRAVALPEKNHRAIAARLALSRPCHPLLDDAAAKVGIDQPVFRASYRFSER
jgi:hypothetical protein